MKNLLRWTTLVLLVATTVCVQAQGIDFEQGTWEEVIAKAQKENKPIFVDAYTTWCGPCKWMAKNIFTQEQVGTYFKQNFIAYKMDMEKGEGPNFAKANNVTAYPTLLYFTSKGEMIHKGIGARDAEGLVSLCNDALDPDKQLVAQDKKYKSGNRSQVFLKSYLSTLMNVGDDIATPFEEYWKMIGDSEKQSKEGLMLLANVTKRFSDFKAPMTQYFLENKGTYEKNVGKQTMSMYLSNCYLYSLWAIARNPDKKAQKTLSTELLQFFPEKKTECAKHLAYIKLTLETPPNEKKVAKAYSKFLKITNDANELNNAAWEAYENADNPQKLKEALSWVSRSISLDENFANLDTKAALLYKMRELEEAKIFAEKALAAAKEEGFETPPEDTQKLLENINSKLEE